MFNNKGGVGNTTLTCNLASFIATEFNKRVLIVDCDPQCNSTQLIMGIEESAEFYTRSNNKISTIKDVLQPIEDGDSDINTDLTFLKSSENRFGVDLLPGHPYLAIIEDRLGAAWSQLRAGDRPGYRQTNWNNHLCRFLENKYDLVMYDLGPSLGSINRSVLIGCQHFLTPLGSDVFSIIGVKNIATWLSKWLKDYINLWNLLEPEEKTILRDRFNIIDTPSVYKGFIGYTVQLYITKSYGKERRATKAYESIIGNVGVEINTYLRNFYPQHLEAHPEHAKLGDIQHLYSLVPLAQKNAVPIHGLTSTDGLVGSQYSAVKEFYNTIHPIAENLLRNLNMLGVDAK